MTLNWAGCQFQWQQYGPGFTCVFCSFFLKSITPRLALSRGEIQVALSSFSHMTFRTAGIMLEKVFSKSLKTALFINSLFRPYFSPITQPFFVFHFISPQVLCYSQETVSALQMTAMISVETTLHFADGWILKDWHALSLCNQMDKQDLIIAILFCISDCSKRQSILLCS